MITKEFIIHRVNTRGQLQQILPQYGIELDLRDYNQRLILNHDPFQDGEDFEEYLKYYNHGTLILNIKSERIEFKVIELINKYNIESYFFLDSSFPMIYSLSGKGEHNIAVRFSEYELLDSVLTMQHNIQWVWIDCFSKLPLNEKNYRVLKDANFKLCLVSPELHGREEDIRHYRQLLLDYRITLDAICTKYHNIDKWLKDE